MKPIAADEFCRFKFLSELTFSPEGKTACLTVTEINRSKNRYESCLWLLKDGRLRKLTAGGKERSFRYLDENTVIFPADREEGEGDSRTSRWYRIRLDGGEAEPAYSFPIPVSEVIPLKGGDLVVSARTVPGFEELYRGDKKYLEKYDKYVKENEDYEEIAQVPWWWNGGSFTKGAYESLFYYDSRKKTLRRLTGLNESAASAVLGPDGETVYYISNPVRPLLPAKGEGSLRRISLPDGEVTSLAVSGDTFEIEGIEAGENFLLVAASDMHLGINTDSDFYKLDYETGKLSLWAKHGESVGTSVGSDIRYGGGRSLRLAGDTLYFISTRFDGAYLYKLEDGETGGEISRVTDRAGSVDCFDVRKTPKGDEILTVSLWDMKGQEIYGTDGRQISRFNERVLRGKYVARPEYLEVGRKGYGIHGFVLKPMDYDPARKYPVIIDIHGGPKTVYGEVFYHEMQYWAGKGYFVIFCNPTGSDGRGDFMDILGKYGTVDYEDIMAFCDAALSAYPAMDKENFFETGGSYGGFMTNWIIGHTDRFKACVSQRSISNWFSMYGISDIGVVFTEDQCMADPWTDREKLWEQSPMKYADRVKTPTLFIHSFEDYRCPIDQGYQMFTSLIAHGVESKMVCFKGENHELSRSGKPAHRLKRLKEITGWFDMHRD